MGPNQSHVAEPDEIWPARPSNTFSSGQSRTALSRVNLGEWYMTKQITTSLIKRVNHRHRRNRTDRRESF